jgi:hypothetical protein
MSGAPHPSLVSPSGSYPVVPRSAPPASAPPVWPPVAADRETGPTPAVPEGLAAALDLTAEMPRIRDRQLTGSQPVIGQQSGSSTAERQQIAARQRAEDLRAIQQAESQRAAEHAAAAHEAATAQAAAAQATAAAQIAAAQAAARQRATGDSTSRFADETMELPIFRELESAWFQTGHPGDDAPKKPALKPAPAAAKPAGKPVATPAASTPAVAHGDDPAATAIISQRFSTAEPTRSPVPQQGGSPDALPKRVSEAASGGDIPSPRTTTVTAAAGNGAPGASTGPGWRTAADDGWQAARAAAETSVETTTTAGLPKRKPMAQLVPGGVDRAGASVQRRTPEAVRGLLSAYHRGVQRGRTKEQSTNPEETPGGQQSSQAGKEHEG